ncbi:unnamed protein product [Prorocentrum cordatum]|uniref:PA domain-containing protein n=1 Tax=Prorocentrum cordatum TaxID=2364126 RepID=A0ABN9X1W1_9DINO|nr:unnamed protein product [Polarella glacialis]
MRLINIAVVRRGGCAFSTKVRVAAEKGAHAVIIVDKEDSTYTRKQMNDVIVAEDSYAEDVHIPSIFVCKQDGQLLISQLRKPNDPVVVELAWNIPAKSVVTVDQWMSSASSESMNFLKSFAPKRKVLNQVLRYQPHFQIFSMGSGGSAQTTSKLCTDSSGKYCAEDPDGEGPVQGKDVIEEDLRQLCLHDKTKKVDRSRDFESHVMPPEYAVAYWDYIEKFQERCPITADTSLAEDKRYGTICSFALMREVGLSEQQIRLVESCADVSRNTEELELQKSHTAWSPRALRINGWRYSGILDPELVATAVCAGFSKEPPECKLVKAAGRDFFVPFLPSNMRGGVSFATLFKSLFVVLALVWCAFYLYKRYMQREMRATIREEVMLEVESQMAQYGKLSG